MNKRWTILLLLCLPLLLSGCGQPAREAAPQPPLEEKMAAALPDWNGLVPYPEDELYDLMDLDPRDWAECVCRVSADGISAREAVAVRAVDGDAARRVADALKAYLERRRRETRDYLPDAYQLLSAADVKAQGVTVVMIVGENAAAESRAALAGE